MTMIFKPRERGTAARPHSPTVTDDVDPESDEVSQAIENRLLVRLVERTQLLWTPAVLVLLIVVFGIVAPAFFTRQNWLATVNYGVEILLLGVGETFVIITAGIDLSVGAVLGFSSMLAAVLMSGLLDHSVSNVPTLVLGIAVAVASAAAVGVVNGVVITKLKLAPFIVTLGMLSAATGGQYLLNNGADVTHLPPQVAQWGIDVFAGWLPFQVIVAALMCVAFGLFLSRTRFGRRTYAIGSNREAARRAGINVDRHLMYVYGIAGAFAGLAGLLLMARLGEASTTAGANAELDAIAAAVIGGASLFGGSGSVWRTVVGTGVISVLVTGLILMNVAPFWQDVAVGSVMVFAVYLSQLRRTLLMRL
jgi:ribose transport system permease protein